eukprot:5411363-Pleurochrysis_carterae.AAC.1
MAKTTTKHQLTYLSVKQGLPPSLSAANKKNGVRPKLTGRKAPAPALALTMAPAAAPAPAPRPRGRGG